MSRARPSVETEDVSIGFLDSELELALDVSPRMDLPAVRWGSFLAIVVAVVGALIVAFPYDLMSPQAAETSLKVQLTEISSVVNDGTKTRQIALLALGGLVPLILLRPTANRARLGSAGLLAIGLLAWMACSIGWSDDPFLSFKRVTASAIVCVTAFSLARALSDREAMLFPVLALGLVVVTGLVSEVVFGSFRPGDPEFRFGGGVHPNVATYHASLLVFGLIALGRVTPRARVACWAMALVATGLVFLTKSRTGIVGLIAAIGLDVALTTSRRTKFTLVGLGLTVAAGVLIFAPDLVSLLERMVLLGRPSSDLANLTGRTDLWTALWNIGSERLWTGYGYGDFWSWRRILEVASAVGWVPMQAHSTPLETMLNLGIVGLALYLGVQGTALWAASKKVLDDRRNALSLFTLVALVSMNVNTLTEIVLFRENVANLIFLFLIARLLLVDVPSSVKRSRGWTPA